MTEMDGREAEMDHLLRRSMAAPVPNLPPNFDQRLMRELRQGSRAPGRYRLILLAVYGFISALTSAAVMRGQGLSWGSIAVMLIAPLALVATVPWAWRAFHTTMRHAAK